MPLTNSGKIPAFQATTAMGIAVVVNLVLKSVLVFLAGGVTLGFPARRCSVALIAIGTGVVLELALFQ